MRGRLSGEFRQRQGTWMTREELLAFMRDYKVLLDRCGHSREEAPQGTRPRLMGSYAVPEPTEDHPTEPVSAEPPIP
nr:MULTISPECIES: hypothetical protein [Streptomyces]